MKPFPFSVWMTRLEALCLIAACLFCATSEAQQADLYRKFSTGFRNPPARAHPLVYHWWLGGHVDTIRLKEEIRAFSDAGVAGFTIFEIGSRDTVLVGTGPEFLGDESFRTIRLAVDEAGKFGMEVGLNTASSWNAGGKWIPARHAAKSIYQSAVTTAGGGRLKLKIPFPEIPERDPGGRKRMIEWGNNGKPAYSEEIAVLAIPAGKVHADTSVLHDVSGHFDPGTETLDWNFPPGDWKIVRYVCANSGENLVLPSRHSAGPIIDHFDAEATAFHFNYIINRLESVLGDLRKTALKSLYMASYEARGFTWTPTLAAEFRQVNGYGIKKLLPALFDETFFPPAITARFKADFQHTLSELMIRNFYMKSKEICNAHGLKNNSEAGGPGLPLHRVPVEPLKALGKGLDIPRGEFWINHEQFNADGIDILRVVKEVSSAAHIYGSRIVEMEAFTSFQHWQEGPFEMKPAGDRAFAEGMNRVVVHGSTHNPAGTGHPGIVYHAGTHYNDKQVWWKKIKPFNQYLARISYLLQEADFEADVLYYYGDTIPNYGGHKHGRFSPGAGYDYELINTEILLNLEVKNGRLVNPGNGGTFRLLALTKEQEIPDQVRAKLNDLSKKGAVISGLKHEKATAGQLLKAMNVPPDFDYDDKDLFTLDYTHYRKDGLDFYFVVNTTGDWVSRNLTFRQFKKTPEVWDPVTGEIAAITIFEQGTGGITLPLALAPYESTFVVFQPGSTGESYTKINSGKIDPPKIRYGEYGMEIWEDGMFELHHGSKGRKFPNRLHVRTLEGAWEVFFDKTRGAPEKAIFPALSSWTLSETDGIRYYSGTARYEKQFVHTRHTGGQPGGRVYLDLGDLSHVAEVWLNGRSLGITWAKPFRFEVTGLLLAGMNKLVVEVANTWSNRITGDAITGQKVTRTHVPGTFVKGINQVRIPWRDVPLIPSGLFGPVTFTTLFPVAGAKELSVARIFSDYMVLQRDKPVPVWGTGTPDDEVAVQLGGHSFRCKVGSDGRWQGNLPAFPAGGPYTLRVQGPQKKVEFSNVLIGDVWFASGQSNMEHAVAGWEWIPHSAIRDAEKELKDTHFPRVRLFNVSLFPSPAPLPDLAADDKWQVAGAQSLAGFSASAWFFAKKLNRELNIPIGIIHSAWGGTSILAWSNPESLDDFSDSLHLKPFAGNYTAPVWKEMVRESISNHRERRIRMSYASPEALSTVLHDASGRLDWQTTEIPAEGKKFGAVTWLKKDITIPEDISGTGLELSLGFLNRQSNVYWNGTELGYFQYPAPVKIKVPASLVKPGRNRIVIRLSNQWETGQVQGKPEAFTLRAEVAEFGLPLAGNWEVLEGLEPIPAPQPSYVNQPSFLFNGMVNPVVPYAIKGVIWNQGEADAARPALYARLFTRLIGDWRKLWRDDRLPFFFVQGSNAYYTHEFGKRTFSKSYLREAQAKALALDGTGMVVSADIGDPYDVHPKNKQDYGNRLALQALKKVYGKDIAADGPVYQSHRITGDTVIIEFEKSSGPVVLRKHAVGNCCFELSGQAGRFFAAEAIVKENKVYVFSPSVRRPQVLRYAWGDNPSVCVFNQAGLPMAPLRIGDEGSYK
ncbi:hypothetical protein GCM10023091_28610 [Ravibacter arvi]|uniref:Sialate O-acetylesterase domain-containing protein n=1 Tax=Ravibacter arvi TaxID=2051041 RepID=A0ABP8M380_9BACT